MRALFGYLPIVAFWILIRKIPNTAANKDMCSITSNINEFRRSFEKLKDFLYDRDTVTDVTLLKVKILKNVQPVERCCILHNMGTFYVTNIFPVLELSVMKQQRDLFHLANSVLSFTKELNKCHAALRCPCGQQSHTIMRDFRETYFKMSTTNAAIKAISELNILFHWMEKNFSP